MSDHDADAVIDDDITPEADSGMMIDELARLPERTIMPSRECAVLTDKRTPTRRTER